MISAITQQQAEFLLLLSKTGFLTNKHLEQVGFARLKTSNHYLTKRLLDGQFIGRMYVVGGFGFARKVLYFLAKYYIFLQRKGLNLYQKLIIYHLKTYVFLHSKAEFILLKMGKKYQ